MCGHLYSFSAFYLKKKPDRFIWSLASPMSRAAPSTPRADVPTDDNDINNSNFQLLSTQYVPGTVLNALSALAHLMLTTSPQVGTIILISLQTRFTEDQRGKITDLRSPGSST